MTKNDRWQQMYREETDLYDFLVRFEDYEGNLLPAITAVCPLAGRRVVEFGAGTGRVTALLLPLVREIFAFDLTPAMVRAAQQKQRRAGAQTWHLGVADSRAMPLPPDCADTAVQGWSFLTIAVQYEERWQAALGRALAEMARVVRPGGTMVLIETLGTGQTEPQVPAFFQEVYDHLEEEWDFARTWTRTDYRFDSMVEARAGLVPFFGEGVLETAVVTPAGVVVPECTGIWWRTV